MSTADLPDPQIRVTAFGEIVPLNGPTRFVMGDFYNPDQLRAYGDKRAREAVPEGWKLVPVEPTEEMLAAAHEADREYTLRTFGDVMTVLQGPHDHYKAMLRASPSPDMLEKR